FGRDFSQEDGIPQPPAPPAGVQGPAPMPSIAILSYEYFQRRYGGNTRVLGHNMLATGHPGPVIVGVLAPDFHLYFPPEANVETAPDIWIADRLDYDATSRKEFTMRPVGRLKDGVSLKRAQTAADNVAAEARKNFSLWQARGFHIEI